MAVALAVLGGSTESGTPIPVPANDNEQFPKPDPTVAEQTLRYLEGDAALVMLMHRTASDLGADPTQDKCDAATTALDRDAPTDQVQSAIAGIPDESLRDAMDGERVSLSVTLTRCAGGEVTGSTPRLDEMTALVQRRLDELEAAR